MNTELKGEQVAEFERIQQFHGIGSRADVVRYLVRKEARMIEANQIRRSMGQTVISAE